MRTGLGLGGVRLRERARIFLLCALVLATNDTLSHDIAWIWPSSGAPVGGYAEAAVLVESFVLHRDGSERLPRLRALALPPGMTVTPVVHVQSAPDSGDRLTQQQRRAVFEAVDRHAHESTSGWLQLDFEVPARQRDDYVALVHDIRARLPRRVRLSVTVQAHWCAQADWLARLDADEVVPMLYRLGPDAARWRARWADPRSGLSARCRAGASGDSLQEATAPQRPGDTARHYWFNEHNWSPNPQTP